MALPRRSLSVFFIALFLVGAFPSPAAAAILGCTVTPGLSIQSAINSADPGDTILICAGIYAEKVSITKSIILSGRPGAILDGSAFVGTRHAISISEGVGDVVIEGLEIRKYDDLVVNEADASSGIVARGSNDNVTITRNSIHDNAFSHVVLAIGRNDGWTIDNNTMDHPGFAHVFAQQATHLKIADNEMNNGDWSLVLAGVANTSVERNILKGNGEAGLVLSPHTARRIFPEDVAIRNNTFNGGWIRGIWVGTGRDIDIRDNTIDAIEGDIILGGDLAEFTMSTNEGDLVLETEDVRALLDLFYPIPQSDTSSSMPATDLPLEAPIALGFFDPARSGALVVEPTCRGPRTCIITLFAAWLPDIFPTARAQVEPECPAICASLYALFIEAVTSALNPAAASSSANDIQKLASCASFNDTCLRTAFINSTDTHAANNWSVWIYNATDYRFPVNTVEMRFIDAGVRRWNESKAWRYQRDDLDQNWTTLVLCRLYYEGVAHNCATMPRLFDYGLDIHWAASATAQHVSQWRLKLPTDIVHDSFDRVHATDATLFFHQSKPHTAESPPPRPATGLEPLPAEDLLRVKYAGTAVLTCSIAPTITAGSSACPAFELLREKISPQLMRCTSASTVVNATATHASDIHTTLTDERGSGMWAWSDSCSTTQSGSSEWITNWSELFTTYDIQELAQADTDHMDHMLQGNDSQAAAARDRAELIFTRAVGRHVALAIEGVGMPTAPHPTIPTASEGSDAILLEWASGALANLHLNETLAADTRNGTIKTVDPALVAFANVSMKINLAYTHLNGETYTSTITTLIRDSLPQLVATPLVVRFEGQYSGNAVAWDADNRDLTKGFAIASRRAITFPLLNVTVPGQAEPIGHGLLDVGFTLPNGTTSFTINATDILSVNASGLAGNIGGLILPTVQDPFSGVFDLLNALNLQYFSDRVRTLEIRNGTLGANFTIIPDPLRHTLPIDIADPLSPWLAINASLPTGALTPADLSVIDGNTRVVLRVPFNDYSAIPGAKEKIIASILSNLSHGVDIVAIEVPDVEATQELQAIIDFLADQGVIILTPADTLPESMRDLRPEDKLMSLRGIATNPRVFTIGIGSIRDGVSPISRLGPTPRLHPKPDFVAPGGNSAVASVMNAAPFVEGILTMGIRDPALVRSTMAGFAVPIKNQEGTAATFWEQGYGALDFGTHLNLTNVAALLTLVNKTAEEVVTLMPDYADHGGDAETLLLEEPADVLGAVADVEQLLRSALGKLMANIVIDTPALPMSNQADFGIVNHDRVGTAAFFPTDLDPVLNRSFHRIRISLLGSAATNTIVDDVVGALWPKINASASEDGQDVTTRVSHYHWNDTFTGDLLYSMYDELLQTAYEDKGDYLTYVTPSNVTAARSALDPWLLDDRHLVNDSHGGVHVNADVQRTCTTGSPGAGFLAFSSVLQNIYAQEVGLLLDQPPPVSSNLFDGLNVNGNPIGFLQTQVRQAYCLEELKDAFEFAHERFETLRALKMIPPGALNETQYYYGIYLNDTLLGHQLNATLMSIGINPGEAAGKNTTILIDYAMVALDRALALIEGKLGLLGEATIVAESPTSNIGYLHTNREATRNSPLGLYVGLARMTSRNVTISNPIQYHALNLSPITRPTAYDDSTHKRNITIPVPSFLYNNPTLNYTVSYRDGSPVTNTTVILASPGVDVFQQVSIDVWDEQGGYNIPLSPSPRQSLEKERQNLLDLKLALVGVLARTEPPPPLVLSDETPFHVFGTPLHTQVMGVIQVVDERLSILNETLDSNEEPELINATIDYDGALSTAISGLTSRLQYQAVTTNESGTAIITNLFPGTYAVMVPYPYPVMANLSKDYAFNAGGEGAFGGPYVDTSQIVGQFVNAMEDTLLDLSYGGDGGDCRPLPHKSTLDALASTPVNPQMCETFLTEANGSVTFHDDKTKELPLACVAADLKDDTCDYIPFFDLGLARAGPYHRSGFNLDGADLLAVSCTYLMNYSERIRSQLSWGYCAGPRISPDTYDLLGHLSAFAACLIGGSNQSLDPEARDACREFRDLNDVKGCGDAPTRDCPELEYYARLVRAALNVTTLPGLMPAADLAYPLVHSPTRLIFERANESGFTADALLNVTRQANDLPDDWTTNITLRAAINDSIDRFKAGVVSTAYKKANVTFVEPDHGTADGRVVAQGTASHSTDRINGMDWANTVAVGRPVVGDPSALLAITDASLLMNDVGPDKLRVGSFRQKLISDPLAEVTGVFQNALTANLSARLMAGLAHARGVQSNAGFDSPTSASNTSIAGDAACGTAGSLTGLTTSYFDCVGTLYGIGQDPAIMTDGQLDGAVFANALANLTRPETAWDDPEESAARYEILRKATQLSVTHEDDIIHRTEDAFVVTSNDSLLGVVSYSTPLQRGEYVQVRLDGQILLENTGAVIITTLKDEIADALIRSMGRIDIANLTNVTVDFHSAMVPNESNLTDPPESYPSRNVSANNSLVSVAVVLDAMESFLKEENITGFTRGEDPLLRVEAFGLPVGIESLPHITTSAIEYRNLFVARPDGLNEYSRVHEFNTAAEGGPQGELDEVHVLVLYFPLIGGNSLNSPEGGYSTNGTIAQKLILRNMTVQTTTFLGINRTGDAGLSLETDWPIVYSNRVEDLKLLYAVPDAQPGVALNVTMTIGNDTFWPSESEYYQPNATRDMGTGCVDTVAPGYHPRRYFREARGFPAPRGTVHGAGHGSCVGDAILGLRPIHVTGVAEWGDAREFWSTTITWKGPMDAINYVINTHLTRLGDVIWNASSSEDDTRALDWLRIRDPTCNKVCQVPAPHAKPLPGSLGGLTDIIEAFVTIQDAVTHAVTGVVASFTYDEPITVDLSHAAPFSRKSFVDTAQAGYYSGVQTATPLHNWIVIDESRMPASNSTDTARYTLHISETSQHNTTRWNGTNAPLPLAFEAQRMPLRRVAEYHTLVSANAYRANTQAEYDGANFHDDSFGLIWNIKASSIIGHGKAGVGVALSVEATTGFNAYDRDQRSLMNGLHNMPIASVKLKTYLLGGNGTVGNCLDAPLFNYVHPYFRCTGVLFEKNTTIEIATDIVYTPCHANIFDYLAPSADALAYTAAASPGFAFYALRGVQADITKVTGPGAMPSGPSLQQILRGELQADETSAASTQSAIDLMACLDLQDGERQPIFTGSESESPSAAPELFGLSDADVASSSPLAIAGSFKKEITDARSTALYNDRALSAQHMRNALDLLHPDLAAGGEPQRLLTTAIGQLSDLSDGFTNLTGNVSVDYYVREWSTHVEHAWLNLTNTASNSTSTIAQYPETPGLPLVNTSGSGGAIPVFFVSGVAYNFSLEAIDDHGYRASANKTIRVDSILPNISTLLPANLYTNIDRLLFWNVSDSGVGLLNARIERLDGTTWTPIFDASPILGQTSALNMSATIPILGIPSGTSLSYRASATDRAGNTNTSSPVIVKFDVTAPNFQAWFVGLTEVTWSRNYTFPFARANDASGLANFTVKLRNDTALVATNYMPDAQYGAGSPHVSWNVSHWLNPSGLLAGRNYFIVVNATDRAGNKVDDRAVRVMDIQVPVAVKVRVPDETKVTFHTKTRLAVHANMTGFDAQAPDFINVTAYDSDTNAIVMWSNNSGSQDVTIPWNVSSLLGEHTIKVKVGTGRSYSTVDILHDVIAPPTPTTIIDLNHDRSGQTYGYSYAAGTKHAYRFTQKAECGSTFYATVTGDAGTDMDLHVQEGAISDPHNEALYTHEVHNGPSNSESVQWTGASPTQIYTILVRHDSGPETPYVLVYKTTPQTSAACDQGLSNPFPPAVSIVEDRSDDFKDLE